MEQEDNSQKQGRFLAVINGPTGIGKTRLCANLAGDFNTSVISADSRQMYREMKIGTAVPSPEELEKAPHYLIGKLSIQDYYNASMFEADALSLLDELFIAKEMVFMTGGSNLYIDALCRGIDDLPAVDRELRKNLTDKYHSHGIAWLRQKLKKVDPDHYEKVDLKNPKRMLKAVEISLMTGKPYSSFLTSRIKKRYFKILKIGLNFDRQKLYDRINRRVDEMIEQGLPEEAELLFPFRHLNALNTVGYRELFDYMEGKTNFDKAVELIKRNSRRYAKRQLTWLAKDPEIKWFHPDDQKAVSGFITDITGIVPCNNNRTGHLS